MIQLLTNRRSNTGREIAEDLRAHPDLNGWINWTGGPVDPTKDGKDVLNYFSRTDKLAQLARLDLKRVPIPGWSLTAKPGWLPRTKHHQQGKDFTHRVAAPDFWVERVGTEDEWRLHFVRTKKGNLRLLRSGIKVPKTDERGKLDKKFHPWVRSHRLGWKLSYTGGATTPVVDAARLAMQALELDFGAVDVGVKSDRSAVVFEVNTCPGLDTGTRQRYITYFVERFS